MADPATLAHAAEPERGTTRDALRAFWADFRRNRGAVIGLAVIALLVLVALLAPLLAPMIRRSNSATPC